MSLATVIFTVIEYDVLTHFQKILVCMISHVYKMEFPCSTIYIYYKNGYI